MSDVAVVMAVALIPGGVVAGVIAAVAWATHREDDLLPGHASHPNQWACSI